MLLSVLEGWAVVFSVFLQRCSCLAPDSPDLPSTKVLLFCLTQGTALCQFRSIKSYPHVTHSVIPWPNISPHTSAQLCSVPSPGPCTGGGSCQPNLSPAQRHKGWTDPAVLFLFPAGLAVCSCLGRHIQTSHTGRH